MSRDKRDKRGGHNSKQGNSDIKSIGNSRIRMQVRTFKIKDPARLMREVIDIWSITD